MLSHNKKKSNQLEIMWDKMGKKIWQYDFAFISSIPAKIISFFCLRLHMPSWTFLSAPKCGAQCGRTIGSKTPLGLDVVLQSNVYWRDMHQLTRQLSGVYWNIKKLINNYRRIFQSLPQLGDRLPCLKTNPGALYVPTLSAHYRAPLVHWSSWIYLTFW